MPEILTRRRCLTRLAALTAAACGTTHLSTTKALAQLPPGAAPRGLEFWLSSPHRTAANFVRDGARSPLETLTFFGVTETSTVVELLPGSVGYYLEILAPWLKDKGRYYAAGRDETAPDAYKADHQKLLARLAAQPEYYSAVNVTQFNGDKHPIAPDGSADFVLTFRNLHNWVANGTQDGAIRAARRALKPGGVFGVVDHRGRNDRPQNEQTKLGYVRQDYAIDVIERLGFRLDATSEVNANAKDTKDYPDGVWTLPPTYRRQDKDRARYEQIGESDRFTLRFVAV